jgi:phosphorylcholine metabolism protein LicD
MSFAEIRDISCKSFDVEAAKEAMLRFKKVMDAEDVPFFLVFGTLLGAYRDKKIIEHDTDIDAAIMWQHIDPFLDAINRLKFAAEGLMVIRTSEPLLSLEFRGSVYLDVYAFKKESDAWHCGQYTIDFPHLEGTLPTIDFLGTKYRSLHSIEQYLTQNYGNDWKVPIRYNRTTA